MAKSKVLMRVASKSSNDRNQESPEPPARPRTSAGEKGLLRRLRLGRMFLGLGSGSSPSQDRLPDAGAGAGAGVGNGAGAGAGAGSGTGLEFGTTPIASAAGLAGTGRPAGNREMQPLHRLFRTGSAQLREKQGDLVSDTHQTLVFGESRLRPPAHGLCGAAHSPLAQSSPEGRRFAAYSSQQAEARKSHYSVLSRRSSAPDIAEAVRRLSRYADASDIDIMSSDLPNQLVRPENNAGRFDDSEEQAQTAIDGAGASARTDLVPVADLAAAPDPKAPSPKSSSFHTSPSADAASSAGCRNGSSGSSATFASAARQSPLLNNQPEHASTYDCKEDSASSRSAESRGSSNAVFLSLPCTHSASTERSPCSSSRVSARSSAGAGCREPRPPMQESLVIVTKIPRAVMAPAAAPEQTTTTGVLSKAAPDIALMWRQQRQSMPESPISPGTSSPLLTSPPGSDRSKRRISYGAVLDSSPSSSVNPTLILMGSVKQRGEKKGPPGTALATTGKSLLVPSKPSSSSLSSSSSESSSSLPLAMQLPPHPNSPAPPPLGPRISSTPSDHLAPTTGNEDSPNRESPSIVLLPIEETYVCSECPAEQAAADDRHRPENKAATELVSGHPTLADIGGARRPRKASMHRRPKSLYEKPSFKILPTPAQVDEIMLPSRASSSIASAKAFLTMIASSAAASGLPHRTPECRGLTIATSGSRSSLRQYSFNDLAMSPSPSSAPISGPSPGFSGIQPIERSRTNTALSVQEAEKADGLPMGAALMDKSDSQASSPGSRSLRVRSRLAGVGIRRASTYVWNRSSVFMRSLSSADDLPESPLHQKAQEHNWREQIQQQQQHQQQHPAEATSKAADAQSSPTEPALMADAGSGMPTSGEADATGHVQAPDASAAALATWSSSEPAAAAAASPIPAPIALKKSPAVMRLHAARELVMTEKNFVDNLFVIKKVWMEPVFSSANSPKPIIPYQTARVVFNGISALHSHASQFYREMDFVLGSFERSQAFDSGLADDGMRIGALFRANDRHWSEFIAYVRNYGTAVNCLKQLQDYKPYQRYHEECMLQKRTNRQSLKDLLMLPIQRITRYTLLLKNILKHTPAMHSDHIDLCRAVKNVTHLASIVNECRRKQEEMYRLIEVFRTIERCPPLPHSDSRAYISEFVVRELISRQPTRLLLFTDLVIVTQAPLQTKLDADGHPESAAEWTYYGMAQLDQVEIQNADESTNTLVTILSLNRNAAPASSSNSARNLGSSRRSLPSGTEPPQSQSNSSGSRIFATASSQNSISDAGDAAEPQNRSSAGSQIQAQNSSASAIAASTVLSEVVASDSLGSSTSSSGRKKPRGRKGLLRVSSRDSVPDHIAALSHSTFPSPVPSPMQLNRSASRLNNPVYSAAYETGIDRDSGLSQQQQQRPKTASGHSTSTTLASSMTMHSPFALHNSIASLNNFGSSITDPTLSMRAQASSELLSCGGPTLASVGGLARSDVAPPDPVQLTLVMQHSSSALRKQFVRTLKDATAKYMAGGVAVSSEFESSPGDAPHSDASTELLTLQPL
ncbi:hypothetical protein LPJ75_001608 [Coemansia sp. RSA 2598]|nr:hypothetical protein LPJ75_001608 [Coemansia sp. RSA 2598]